MKAANFFFLGSFFLVFPLLLEAQVRWYRSNSAGMALEEVFSRLALRGGYALSVEARLPGEVPRPLLPYYEPSFRVEVRTLFEERKERRRQWIFLDENSAVRLAAVFDLGASTPERPAFIEVYGADKRITGEYRFDEDDSVYATVYTYSQGFLVMAETRRAGTESGDSPPDIGPETGQESWQELWIDQYRYTRSGSLRAVERVYRQRPPEDAQAQIRFPHVLLGAGAENLINSFPAFSSGFFSDILADSADRVLFTTDERGRVLRETRRDESGKVIGEMVNTWSGERLSSVQWTSEDDDRLTEYEYDEAGDRILERNYSKGVLERVVRKEGEGEVEELYMNGRMVLRALWEGGRKVSEERFRSGREGGQ